MGEKPKEVVVVLGVASDGSCSRVRYAPLLAIRVNNYQMPLAVGSWQLTVVLYERHFLF